MHFHCSEIDAEDFLERFLPGEDPSAEALQHVYKIAEKFASARVLEKDLNVQIVRNPSMSVSASDHWKTVQTCPRNVPLRL